MSIEERIQAKANQMAKVSRQQIDRLNKEITKLKAHLKENEQTHATGLEKIKRHATFQPRKNGIFQLLIAKPTL
jgi:ribosomal protein S15P/S13E